MKSSIYHVIGLMSGSSLDGLDIAYCTFQKQDTHWEYAIQQAACIPYDTILTDRLRHAPTLSGMELSQLHIAIAHHWAEVVNAFMTEYELHDTVDFIASHGHTVFHYPTQQYTTQIGDPAALAVRTATAVVAGFREADVALGGQGTPIVPIGDYLLFDDYDYLLNIGGIANITIKHGDQITAYDICTANQVLNHYARECGQEYDKDGAIATSGKLHHGLLAQLNALPYYQLPAPKSLDNSYATSVLIPLIEAYGLSAADVLHTYSVHIAQQVAKPLHSNKGKLLVTGGGAFNGFVIDQLRKHTAIEVVIPDEQVVQYKEALVMALMGVLRWRGEINVLCSVTGASRDSCGGAIYLP